MPTTDGYSITLMYTYSSKNLQEIEEIEKKLPGFPIVLHGSSSVPVQYVKIIEQYGGKGRKRMKNDK